MPRYLVEKEMGIYNLKGLGKNIKTMGKKLLQIKILKYMRIKKQAEWSGIHAGNIHLLENFSLQRRQKICRNQVTYEISLYKY